MYNAVAGIASVKMNKSERDALEQSEAMEARLIAKFGPDCFAFRDLMDDLDRKGMTDLVLHPLLNYEDENTSAMNHCLKTLIKPSIA